MEKKGNDFVPYSLKVIPHIFPENKYAEILKSKIKQKNSFSLNFLNTLLTMIEDDNFLKQLMSFDFAIAQSIENQITQIEFDINLLLMKLQTNPQEIFFEMNPGAQIIQCHPEIPHLWHQIVLSKNPREEILSLRRQYSNWPQTIEHFFLCTILSNTEIHQISADFYKCTQFLIEDSSSLEALIFEYFDPSKIAPAELFVGKLISMGAILNFKTCGFQ